VPDILNYLLHLATATALVLAFFIIYTKITPWDEVTLIRAGNTAAAWSLGGTLIGFSLTLSSALKFTGSYVDFLMWGGLGMVVQVLVFYIATLLLKMSQDQIEADNTGFGVLLGSISISIGLINGGCIS
jgi:putative membrane protein